MNATLSRRGILLGIAAAATATSAAGAAPAVAENPALLALADQLPATLQAFQDAKHAVAQIVAEWSPSWPSPAPEITWYGEGSKTHRDIEGWGIETPWGRGSVLHVARLGTPEAFQEEYAQAMARVERKRASKGQRGLKWALTWADRYRAAIEPARAYWGEVDRITAASGIKAAQARHRAARDDLHRLVDATLMEPETTIEGLAIKAQALAAWSQVESFHKAVNIRGGEWSEQIAAAILRQASA